MKIFFAVILVLVAASSVMLQPVRADDSCDSGPAEDPHCE